MMKLRPCGVPFLRYARVIPTQLVLLAVLTGTLSAENLALQISSETAPAGGWVQIKISSAMPQLVAAGRIVMKFDPAVFGNISDLAVFSAQGDAAGFAIFFGQSVDVSLSSPAGGIGQLPYLPMLTVTIPVLASAPAGTMSLIAVDASQGPWTDAKGNKYSVTVIPGSVTVGGSLSVRNLIPGGGLLPAGTLVRINGTGFSAATTARIDGVLISNTQFAAAGEIDLTLGGAADLTGKRVVLRNSDGSQVEYFPDLPSAPDRVPPGNFTSIQPLLSMQTWTAASTSFTHLGGAIALQNPNLTAVDVNVFTPRGASTPASQTTVTIPPGGLILYSTTSEGLFVGNGLQAFASLPIRMLGLAVTLIPGPGIDLSPILANRPPVQQLSANPAAVSFRWQAGTALPSPVSVELSAIGVDLAFKMTSSGTPFSVTATQTKTPATLTVAVNPVGLSAGTYSGNIVLTPEGPNATVTTIPLSLTVGAALLAVNPQSLTLSGDSLQGLKVESNGNPISFTVAATTGAGPQWLTVDPSSGTTPVELSVTVSSTGLSDGIYSGQIVITGPNNTVTVPVQFSSHRFTFSPTSVTFSTQTGSDPPPQTVLVQGPSTVGAFSASTSSGGSWLSVTKTPSGQLGAMIAANPTGLKAGTYNGTVTLTSPASPFPAAFPVTLVLWDKEPILTVTPPSVTYTAHLPDGPATPTQFLQVSSGGVPLNFSANPFFAVGNIFVTPASIPAIASYPQFPVVALGAYTYDLTITAGSQKVVVPVTTVVTTSPVTPPFMGSIVNAASQIPGSVAPGEILSIYGFGAGPSNTAGFTLDPSGKVATSLNGAQVLFDGRPAPMIYGSASQANVIVPYEVANQATTTVALQFGDVTSAAWAIPVAGSAPGIFTVGSTGLGQAAVLNQDNSVNGASNPAPRGSIIQIYATGEGQTSPPGVTGSVSGTDLKTPVLRVKVTIGGQDAVVQYSGSAGSAVAGLFQVNAVIPQSVAPGAAVPISVSVGGVLSQGGVTIAVQ